MKIWIYYILGLLGLRESDIILSSFPRSGSTWVRLIFCHLIDERESLEKKVTYRTLNEVMVELGANNLLPAWKYKNLPRVVKTHLPYRPLFKRCRGAIGIIRNPRDVMVSYYHFKKDRLQEYDSGFPDFIRDPNLGLRAWFKHYQSWKDRWDLMIRYEDLLEDDFPEVQKMLDWMEVDVPDSMIKKALDRSALPEMQKLEGQEKRKKQARMVRSGKERQWPAYFTSQDLAYFKRLADENHLALYRE